MVAAANYSVVETLRGGRSFEIRALRPSDRDSFMAAVELSSSQSLYRRFFGPKRHFSEAEQSFFLNPDFVKHVALVAIEHGGGGQAIAGGGRYIVTAPGRAEVAFMVADKFQGLGIGASLLRHLVTIARETGLRELSANVFASNIPMLKVFDGSGLPHSKKREGDVVSLVMKLF